MNVKKDGESKDLKKSIVLQLYTGNNFIYIYIYIYIYLIEGEPWCSDKIVPW